MKYSVILTILSSVYSTIYFSEEFSDGWENRWVHSKRLNVARFKLSPGWWNVDENDIGLHTIVPYKRYAISAAFPPFSNKNKTLILQYTVQIYQQLDCGGGYIKLMPPNFNSKKFNYQTPFTILFGPDICGGEENGLFHIRYKEEVYQIKEPLRIISDDHLTHQYTLILRPDNTFTYMIDNVEENTGTIKDSFDFEVDDDGELEEQLDIKDIGGVGFEILQTTAGILLDNVFIGDNLEEAKEFSRKTFQYKFEKEPEAKRIYGEQQETLRVDYNKEHNKEHNIEL